MFLLSRPSIQDVERFLAESRELPLSYGSAGLTKQPRAGFKVDEQVTIVGSGEAAFRRLERDGLIRAEWRSTENNRQAKYYALTPQGRAHLKRATREWETQTAAISSILEASLGEIS